MYVCNYSVLLFAQILDLVHMIAISVVMMVSVLEQIMSVTGSITVEMDLMNLTVVND